MSTKRLLAACSHRRPRFIKWEKPDGRGSCCYYCVRTHERRYASLSRKALVAKVKEKNGDPDRPNEHEKFLAAREKSIKYLEKLDRAPCLGVHGKPQRRKHHPKHGGKHLP